MLFVQPLRVVVHKLTSPPIFQQGETPETRSEVTIEHASEVSLVLFRDRSHSYQDEYISPLQEQTATAEATLRIKISGERGTFEIPVKLFSFSLSHSTWRFLA